MSHSDFPGIKNSKAGLEAVWIYHGVATSAAQAFAWRTAEKQGYCPWCGKDVSRKHGNMNKHLRACKSKPTEGLVVLGPIDPRHDPKLTA